MDGSFLKCEWRRLAVVGAISFLTGYLVSKPSEIASQPENTAGQPIVSQADRLSFQFNERERVHPPPSVTDDLP